MIALKVTGTLIAAGALLASVRPQIAAQELRVSDLSAQQTQDVIFASPACRRVAENPRHIIAHREAIRPDTMVQDLRTLMEESDEVILAGKLDGASLLSPSGESTATYWDVRVIHAWKGSHHAGDILTFGMQEGTIHCAAPRSSFWVMPGEGADDWNWPALGPYAYVLFLRQSKGQETKLIQGLRPTAGEGVQGLFSIRVPMPVATDPEAYCADALQGNVEHCDAYLRSSQSPVAVPYSRDPLARKYGGMPASVFLREVQSAAGQGSTEEPSPR